ncbi:DUF2065 domain-containing protein [Ideonella dechloratans]|uniref:DUF2065 domain-containing protein n=1 Tax=Ideonella dechloratans TaxID=36863 RepID=A0A643F9Z1_IDEDE|nr:DUF2065 domain-containing protein [Ideonella dechloratans]KAB0579963.1 DUF2065 domain-containing protein [Ideonella dechloratans]UFU08867.1 DUF2065 domain-containing protein [Ideonella dechloratans]
MADLFWAALGLMLVMEGLLPFLNPRQWRAIFQRAAQLSDGQIRFLGCASLCLGGLVLWLWGLAG